MIYLALVIAALLGLIVYLLIREHKAFQAWDIERGRYVAALLSQSKAGDLAASAVVRPRPARPDPAERPKPVQQLDM